jgi:hypothetical protein
MASTQFTYIHILLINTALNGLRNLLKSFERSFTIRHPLRTSQMRNASYHQSQVKVAVIAAPAPSPEAQRQQLHEQIVIVFIGLSALAAFWAA